MTEQENLFSIDDILEGRSQAIRRAQINLFAIESRTARLAEQTRVNLVPSVAHINSAERSHLFLDTLASGGHDVHVTIQQLERFAPRWASLIPDAFNLRAEIAYMLSQEYRFTYEQIPNIRQALGLDTVSVQSAYQDIHKQPIDQIYIQDLSLPEQFQWSQANFQWRIQDLPPFWIAFALNFTGTVGAGILALPIALATIGPLAAVIVIIILGLVNMVTMTAFIEAVTRNGNMRYGSAFMAQLVRDYLGRIGSFILSIALLVLAILMLTAYYLGLASTLAESLGIPSIFWAALLFVAVIFFLRRKSLNMTVASAMIVAFINFLLLVGIMFLTAPYIQFENLNYVHVPFVNNVPFEVEILQLIFGVVLIAFFKQVAVINASKITLSRDPSGKALLWGNIAGLIVAIILYSVWVTVVIGAISPDVLSATTSTALAPLAVTIGSAVAVIGSVYVVLGMGLNAVLYSLLLFNQIREWLPRPLSPAERAKLPNREEHPLRRLIARPNISFWMAMLPIIIHFLVIEWILLTGRESFTGLLSFVGVITVPIIAGIFPSLMLLASRRKGDYMPKQVLRVIGHPIVLSLVYFVFFFSILLHGLLIWQNPFEKIVATLTALLLLLASVLIIRRGAFTPRDVLEIRVDDGDDGRATFKLLSRGLPHPVHVTCDYGDARHTHTESDIVEGVIPNFPELQYMSIQLPETPAQELKIWTHRVTPEGISESLPVHVEMDHHEYTDPIPMHELEGIFILPIGDIGHLIDVSFEH